MTIDNKTLSFEKYTLKAWSFWFLIWFTLGMSVFVVFSGTLMWFFIVLFMIIAIEPGFTYPSKLEFVADRRVVYVYFLLKAHPVSYSFNQIDSVCTNKYGGEDGGFFLELKLKNGKSIELMRSTDECDVVEPEGFIALRRKIVGLTNANDGGYVEWKS